eukprot:TRINITY_DN498_c0_g1_i1.p1 TRINITY_DN498_c0_g1~~TRINITY_DN498_c0_g1_i1.p1  ORF type:complete len:698 (-),score=239.46 TRINITY_DN498_c0_g1_i1:716-2809(-)
MSNAVMTPSAQPSTASVTTTQSSASNPSFSSASLYVGDLHPDVSESQLFELFSQVGQVGSVRVCRDLATRRSLGYAYVNFHRLEDAERALDTLNFHQIRGKQIRIMWSQRDPGLRKSGLGNIFVKNLAKTIDNKTLYDTFSFVGNILSCKVATNSKGESLGYGFVHYETEESAKAAIEKVDGKEIAGSKVMVAAFKSKMERGGADKSRFTNVYCKNVNESWTKEKFVEMFSKFGTINSTFFPVHEEKDKTGKNKGFGMVNFADPAQAAAAVEALNNRDVEGKKLVVCRAQKREERERDLRQKMEAMKAERARKFAGVNLYVKNLADTVDDEKLKKEFERFGSITSAKVMNDEKTKKSKGFGFVCFSTPEEATRAVTDMVNVMFEGKPLYVALAQRKEARRAQLEQQFARSKMAPMQQMQQNQWPQQIQQQPMFYQQYMPQQLLVSRRWNNNVSAQQQQVQQAQLMSMQRFGNVMPMGRHMGMQARGGMGGRGRGGNMSGGRGMNKNMQMNPMMVQQQQVQQIHPQQQRMPTTQQQQQPTTQAPKTYTYTAQVRNVAPSTTANTSATTTTTSTAAQESTSTASTTVSQTAPVTSGAETPLTSTMLAQAPEEDRKQMIGERLFPRIERLQPKLAGKITGMLLEMDNGELLHLLDNHHALADKVDEALNVLKQSGVDDEPAPTTAPNTADTHTAAATTTA